MCHVLSPLERRCYCCLPALAVMGLWQPLLAVMGLHWLSLAFQVWFGSG